MFREEWPQGFYSTFDSIFSVISSVDDVDNIDKTHWLLWLSHAGMFVSVYSKISDFGEN